MIASKKKFVSITEQAMIRPRRGPPVIKKTTKMVATAELPKIIAVS